MVGRAMKSKFLG